MFISPLAMAVVTNESTNNIISSVFEENIKIAIVVRDSWNCRIK
jgi:hypothetical protein